MKAKALVCLIVMSMIGSVAHADEQILRPGQSLRINDRDTVSCVPDAPTHGNLPPCEIHNIYEESFFVYVGDKLVKRFETPFRSKANLKDAIDVVKDLQAQGACGPIYIR
jgi:hypothetical protein